MARLWIEQQLRNLVWFMTEAKHFSPPNHPDCSMTSRVSIQCLPGTLLEHIGWGKKLTSRLHLLQRLKISQCSCKLSSKSPRHLLISSIPTDKYKCLPWHAILSVQTGSGAHPASSSVGVSGKSAGMRSWLSTPSNTEVENDWSYTFTALS